MYLFESLNQLIQTYLPEDQIKRLQQAYLVARDAHEGQTRSSGEPYITHPVAVACILAEMKLDYETLMAALLHDVIDCCPYTIECAYSDNGVEYRGNAEHPFGVACVQNNIEQKFTRPARPQTNGKAERVIRTLMEMWHSKTLFQDAAHRQKELCRFVNFYNTVKPHKSLKGDTPFEVLQAYFSQPVV